MIVPMKKCLIVMLESERKEGLKALRSLGLVHPEPVVGSGEALERIKAERELYERTLGALDGCKAPKRAKARGLSAEEASREFARLVEEEKAVKDRLLSLVRERDRISLLGEFDPKILESLSSPALRAKLHLLGAKEVAAFPEESLVVDLGADKGKKAFLSFTPPGEAEDSLPPSFALPEMPLSAIEAEIARAREDARRIEAEKGALRLEQPAIRAAFESAARRERFENLRTGVAGEGPIAYLRGWLPAQDEKAFLEETAKRGWGVSTEDPGPEDQPPTKVRNNPIVRVVQPVFDFLGTVPNYREYEISAWFLIFFCVFFAMIFGDGGYGALMFVAAGIVAIRAKAARKPVPDGIRLFLLLAFFTLVWGAITGSWFALKEEALPERLRALAIPAIASWNPDSGDNVKILCFVLGLVQLVLAHSKNILRDIKAKSLKFLGQIGSLALVVGMFWLVLNLVIDPARFPVPNYSLYLIFGGFGLVFVFSNYERNILQSLVDGVKNIIPTFLGTVSVFADLVSYIRLWAVGLAGVAISETVNGMGGGFLNGFSLMTVAGIVIIAFGHGLNLVMGALSVIVHGVRLNMLEFSSHLGMEWSGYKYEPLRDDPAGAEEKEPI